MLLNAFFKKRLVIAFLVPKCHLCPLLTIWRCPLGIMILKQNPIVFVTLSHLLQQIIYSSSGQMKDLIEDQNGSSPLVYCVYYTTVTRLVCLIPFVLDETKMRNLQWLKRSTHDLA